AFRAVYNNACEENSDLPPKPTKSVQWNAEQRRTSVIPPVELKGWYDRAQALGNPVRRDYLVFALFSGLRKTNAAEARWEHIDWERRALRVPAPKSRRPFDLPLSDFLIELLRRRQQENAVLAPNSPWVFPAARGDGHLVETRSEAG